MAESTTEIDLDSVIDRLLEGAFSLHWRHVRLAIWLSLIGFLESSVYPKLFKLLIYVYSRQFAVTDPENPSSCRNMRSNTCVRARARSL
jgi:hypothetical protein